MRRPLFVALLCAVLTACQAGGALPATGTAQSARESSPSKWQIAYQYGVTYQGVTLGVDGAIWMCDGGFGTTLDRFTSLGPPQKYELGYEPEEITVGADRALWLTTNESTVLRVTTALKITAYPVSDVLVGGIVLGSDHNVWFVEQHYIGRISPAGKLKEYPMVVGSSQLTASGYSGLAWGPDGRLWFGASSSSGQYIVKLNPRTRKIKIMGPGSLSMGPIVAAPDGNIWYIRGFTQSTYQTILTRITTSGQATTYYGPPRFIEAGTPSGMVVGPDGGLWFATQRISRRGIRRVVGGGLVRYDIRLNHFSASAAPHGFDWEWGLTFDSSGHAWLSANTQAQVFSTNS